MNDKSIAYAFIANGVQIYFNDEGEIIVTKLVCNNCGDTWYTNLTECFLCGAINSFLFTCGNCGQYHSITKSSRGCTHCNSNNLYYDCSNPECISNINSTLQNEIRNKGGVFNKDSGMLISLQYCLNCGSNYNKYKYFIVNVITIGELKDSIKIDYAPNEDNPGENAYTILRLKLNEQIHYLLTKTKELETKTFTQKEFTINFNEIVNKLFPVRKITV